MPSSSSSYHHHLFNSRSRRHGYSKAQLCFFKILYTISSVPPPHRSAQQHSSRTGGIAVDLNLRFCSVAEDDAEFRDSDENGSDSDGDYLAVKSPPAAARTTKRGRSQALPYRFRDSVVEPLKRRGRPYKRLIGSS
ncbi:putative GATA zinc finger domain-containing protein 25 [Senna tora]|uniref:Putative GATA zinc finger domain-containing protein 25 n=1 Tax=Senna tora TaxID=362788 RepID=A0A834TLS3_9FABA|nr:putative GATA zinc finger domain-containing protein 25 [Senna tora]